MRDFTRLGWGAARCGALLGASLLLSGCGGSSADKKTAEPGKGAAQTSSDKKRSKGSGDSGDSAKSSDASGKSAPPDDGSPPVAAPIKAFDAPEKLEIPEVKFSSAEAKTCLVKQGDTLPDATLPDLAGGEKSVAKTCDGKLTLVVVVETDEISSEEPLKFLTTGLEGAFAGKGLKTVAVHVGGEKAQAVAEAKASGVSKTVHLFDGDKAWYGKIATGKLPRIFLVDDKGKVVWFDLEFSRSARRDLNAALQTVLGKPNE